jgi:hypothetical protein
VSRRLPVATYLGIRELARRRLLLLLLVGMPFFFITRSIASTVIEPRLVTLPSGGVIVSNMRDIHGATMAAITVAFLAGLCGLFVMQSAREADRRLVIAGFRPWEAILPRLCQVTLAVGLVMAVALAVTAASFQPEHWVPFAIAVLFIGLTLAAIGAIAGVLLGRLGGTYFMLFLPMIDLGIAQTPMFGDGVPGWWGELLPGYGAGRVLVEASFAPDYEAWGALAISAAWALAALAVTVLVLSRGLGVKRRRQLTA